MTSKELIRKYFEIGSIIWEEALQCALVTAELMNNTKLIEELTELYQSDLQRTNSPLLEKYYKRKTGEQMKLFEKNIK